MLYFKYWIILTSKFEELPYISTCCVKLRYRNINLKKKYLFKAQHFEKNDIFIIIMITKIINYKIVEQELKTENIKVTDNIFFLEAAFKICIQQANLGCCTVKTEKNISLN